MNKEAQITFIILIAVFIVIIAALIIYAAGYFTNKASIGTLVFGKASIENYINNCIKSTAENGLKLLGEQGSIAPDNYLQTPYLSIQYYLYNNQSKAPSIEEIQNELASYINDKLGICLKDFEDFKKQGWNVEKGVISSKAQINEQDVSFEINFPIDVSNNGDTINFEKFASILNVRLKYIYNLVSAIIDFNIKNPRSIDRTALNNYNVNITMFPYQDSLVYGIDDSESVIMNSPYRFNFALKFE